MPVTLTPTTNPLTSDDIRAFLRDQPNYNILLDDVEFSNEDITRAMRLAAARYNAYTPVSTLSWESMNEWILLCGVCCILLRSEGIRQVRNQSLAQDGNISPVGLDEKQGLYAEWSEWFCQEFEKLALKIKMQANMESVYDGLGSGYRYLGRYATNA